MESNKKKNQNSWNDLHNMRFFLSFSFSLSLSLFLSLSLSLSPTSSTYSLYAERVIDAPDHIQWHTHTNTTLSRPPPDDGSARRRDLYMTTNSHKTEIHASAKFEPAIPASEHSQTHALDHATTKICSSGKTIIPLAKQTYGG